MRDVEVSLFPELRSNKAVGPLVPSVIAGNNADLMASVAPMYLTGSVLDVTYGRGKWWDRFKPDPFQGHDLAVDGVDFTDLPYPDRSWDTVCFDPPYVASSGESTTKTEFRQCYGLASGHSRKGLEKLVLAGLTETARVSRRFLLVKCMDFAHNPETFLAMSYQVHGWAKELGLKFHDEIVHHAGPGPGGHNIVNQLRARRHHSKLLVFTKGTRYS